MRMNAYAVAVAASIAKLIANTNTLMIVSPALTLALAKEPEERKNDDSKKVFEIKFSKFQICQRITHT